MIWALVAPCFAVLFADERRRGSPERKGEE